MKRRRRRIERKKRWKRFEFLITSKSLRLTTFRSYLQFKIDNKLAVIGKEQESRLRFDLYWNYAHMSKDSSTETLKQI